MITELPFAFAEKHNVFLDNGQLFSAKELPANIVLELQRYLGVDIHVTSLSESDFKSINSKVSIG